MKKNIEKHRENKINKMIKIFTIISICLNILIIPKVYGATYTNDTNLTTNNSYVNQLIDMANNQIKNFETKKYVIIQIQYDYYLFVSDEVTTNGNRITMNDTTIFKAIRTNNNYNYYYTYSKTTETSSIVNANYLIFSNINSSNSMSNERVEEYEKNENIKKAIIFIIAIIFAILLMKGRK